jgi:two-component system sensor histidine kinase ChiS
VNLKTYCHLVLLIGIAFRCLGQEQKVEAGVIDLTQQAFTNNISLEGEWQFIWNKLINPDSTGTAPFELTTVPSSWTDKYPNFGFASFRIRLLMPPRHQNVCVRFTNVKSAFKIWMNGELIDEVGHVGTSKSLHKGTYQSFILQLPPNTENIELVLHVSNYSQFQSGILSPPLLGVNHNMIVGFRDQVTIKVIFVCSLLILSLYCLLQFFVYDYARSYLYLFSICCCVAVRVITSSGIFLTDMSLDTLVRIEFLAVFSLVIFFPLYVVSIFSDSYKRWALNSFLISGVALLIIASTTGYSFYRDYLNVAHGLFIMEFIYAGIIVKRNFSKSGKESRFIVLGLLISLPFLIVEVLRNSGIIILQIDFLLELGVLLFLCVQGLLLHYKHQTELVEIRFLSRELDEFLYRTSHDFRTPIVGIRGLVNLMEVEPTASPVVLDYNSQIKKSVENLDGLLKNIRTISANNKEPVMAEQIYLRESLEKCARESVDSYPSYKIDVEVVQDRPFYGDIERLKVIFQHIIANAVAFRREEVDGRLSINCLVDSSGVSISFADNGIGIADDQREKVFQMFYRGSERSKGVGLGLYMAKAMVDKLKGKIHIRSSSNEGTEFLVTIPHGSAPREDALRQKKSLKIVNS